MMTGWAGPWTPSPTKPAPKSLRPRSGQGPGRPKGQDGVTLERFADPDEVVRHLPAVCRDAVVGVS